jgi:catalase (peroxidase I)
MAKPKTHTGTVIRKNGEATVKLHMTATAWVASKQEYYYRDSGQRCGANGRARLLLDTIKPIVIEPQDD